MIRKEGVSYLILHSGERKGRGRNKGGGKKHDAVRPRSSFVSQSSGKKGKGRKV